MMAPGRSPPAVGFGVMAPAVDPAAAFFIQLPMVAPARPTSRSFGEQMNGDIASWSGPGGAVMTLAMDWYHDSW